VTASRLLTTLYVFGGISALLYGTSTYLVTPMVASLTESRHTLAETAQTNLDKLTARLSELVSQVPDASQEPYKDDVEDSDSDSDPTELFHRDIGVQTSLPTTPTTSRPSTPDPESISNTQTTRLTRLSTSIKDLSETSTSEGGEVQELSSTIGVLRDYLDDLAYAPSAYKYGTNNGFGTRSATDVDDEIGKVKQQIRGLKGVLLSARSFPGGGGLVRTR
jgi:hypothetical protein